MRPQLHAPYFDFAGDAHKWRRMAAVLEHSARQHCPNWDLHVDQIQVVAEPPFNKSANASKLHDWTRRVCEAPDGAQLLLMDSDCVIQRPLDDIWERPFDIAFTHRRPCVRKIPINGGVVFLRVSEPVRAFFCAWLDENVAMLRDKAHHRRWYPIYGGMNQSALGAMLEGGRLEHLKVEWLPCSEWNVADAEWASHWKTGRILHLKGDLRLVLFEDRKPRRSTAHLVPMVQYWRGLEAALGV